ncbi:MAG: right-handed parallel beta-helix repeat-containing protein [Candidatus Woesearchaeota archaeon]
MSTDGKVCSGGSEVNPDSDNYCDRTIDCNDNECSANRWYRGCTAGDTSCTDTNRQSYSSWNAPQDYVIDGNTYKTGTSCDTNQNLCGYSSYNSCSSDKCSKKRDEYRCDGSGNCDYDVGDDWTAVGADNVCSGGDEVSGACEVDVYTDYQCAGTGCGDDAQKRYADDYCDGSGNCDVQGSWKSWQTQESCGAYEKCSDGSPSSCYYPQSTYNDDISSTDDPAVRDDENVQCHSMSVTNECGYENIGRVLMLVNYGTSNDHSNPRRGYFQWCDYNGYSSDVVQRGGDSSYGNEYVTIDSSSSTSASGSASGGSGTVTVDACYTLATDYGEYDDNDVSYYWGDAYGSNTADSSCDNVDWNSGWNWPTSEDQRFDTVECDTGNDCAPGEYCRDSDNTCQDLPQCAEANSGTGYSAQEEGEDLWNDCTDSGWDGCDGTCTKTKSNDGACAGGETGPGSCGTDSSNLENDGYVCSGGSEVDPDSGNYCDRTIDCNDNSCSANRWYRGCAAGETSCTDTNRQSYSTWNTASGEVINEDDYKTGTSCSVDSQYCSGTDHCSGDTRYTGYTCDGGGNCDVDKGDIGCCQSAYCSSGDYCRESDYSCQDLQTCAEANTDFGYSPQEDDEDLWDDCSIDWNSCDSSCVRRGGDGFCEGGSYSCDTDDATENIDSGYVCTGSGSVTAVSQTDYCDYAETCDEGDCSATEYFRSCDGSGSCRTDNTDSATNTITASSNKVLDNSCSEIDASSTATSCDGSIDYYATASECTYTGRYAECDGSGNCDTDSSTHYEDEGSHDVPSGSVAVDQSGGSGDPYVEGDSDNYASSDSPDRCSEPDNPENGLGDPEYDVFACDGSGGSSGPDVGNLTQSCSGCCYDAGSSANCIDPGDYNTYDYYDFGTGDSGATDYCSAEDYLEDCYNDDDCESGYHCDAGSCSDVCTENDDCLDNQYCDSTGTCEDRLSDGATCEGDTYEGTGTSEDEACVSGYCDNDGVGADDDGWCFTPVNTSYDNQDDKCEKSADASLDDDADEYRDECRGTSGFVNDTCSYLTAAETYQEACQCQGGHDPMGTCSDGQAGCWENYDGSMNCCDGTDTECDGTDNYAACVSGTYRTNPDDYEEVCTCGGSDWDDTGIEFEAGVGDCCGDDADEHYNEATYDATMDGTADGTSACCDDNADCVDSSNCYTTADDHDTDGDGDTDYCSDGTWYDCDDDSQCGTGYYCNGNDCDEDSLDVTYEAPTPADGDRTTDNEVTINITVQSEGSDVDTCTLEWQGSNETMTKQGSGTTTTCHATKATTDGTDYDFKAYANNTVGTRANETERTIRENDEGQTEPYINPEFSTTLNDLNCSTNYTDAEDDMANITFTWYVAGSQAWTSTKEGINAGTNGIYDTLTYTNYTTGEEVTCEVTSHDGYEQEPAENDTITIGTACNYTLTEDRTLHEDVSDCLTNGLNIAGDGLTLDCAGYVIGGVGGFDGVNIEGRRNVTVEDCTIESFATGVRLARGVNDSMVKNNTIHNNTDAGLVLAGTENNTIMRNTITDNGDGSGPDAGIHTNDSTCDVIENNTITSSTYTDYHDYRNDQASDVSAPLQWWGTTDLSVIEEHIHDHADDQSLGVVDYCPILNATWPDGHATGGEVLRHRECDGNACTTDESDQGCCDEEADCIYQNTCYDNATAPVLIDGEGDSDYCEEGFWNDCGNDTHCDAGHYCDADLTCQPSSMTVAYEHPTPSDGDRTTDNEVTINITVQSEGSDVDTCTLEWQGSNETMTKQGSGTTTTCHATKATTDGTDYDFKAYANNTVGTRANETERTIRENALPDTPTPDYPEDGDEHFTNRTPRFNWTESNDADGDAVNYTFQLSLTDDFSTTLTDAQGLTDNQYEQSKLDFAQYFWRVQATDGYENTTWSETSNFTLAESVIITLVEDNVTFPSTLDPGDVEDTTDDLPQPFRVRNDGNTYADLVNASANQSLFERATLGTTYWQYRIDNVTGEEGAFDWSDSLTTWTPVNGTNTSLISRLNYTDERDEAEVEVYIEIPEVEPPGQKQASINFWWEESP